MRNFFEHQAAARRRTGWLVVYFVLAIIATVAVTYGLVAAIFAFPDLDSPKGPTLWHPLLLVGVVAAVLALVGGCTLYKVAELASGGTSVALLMGGTELVGQTRDLKEKRLLNVVEEMAIASGVPVPPVYVMEEEDGINAFAAGYAPGSAVVAVSRGCLEYLSRDELQGVIAHEFSHILNGDMRLNIRLIALIFGIMGLAIVGMLLMRSGGGRSRDRGQFLLLGLGLYIIGSVGALFGNLIKAAVSRQREYLADASAVQFTRNPDGIGGALMKIGGLEKGPNLKSPHAAEVSHMFFADALSSARLTSLFATHPPLDDRIRRVNPHWDGTYPKVRPSGVSAEESRPKAARVPPFAGVPTLPGMPQVPLPVLAGAAEDVVEVVGTVTPAHTAYAADLLAGLPEQVQEAAREPFSARALIYALLLDAKPAIREAQLACLRAEAEARDYGETMRLAAPAAALPDAARLPLVDLAMPALRRMSPAQYETFREQIDHLTAADQCVSLFEYVLRCVLERHLDKAFGRVSAAAVGLEGRSITAHGVIVLSRLAWEGQEEEAAARKAYDTGMRHLLGDVKPPAMLPRADCDLGPFDQHLRRLAAAPPAEKRRLLLACAASITADRQVTVREGELYRAIGAVLGCPIPPLGVGS